MLPIRDKWVNCWICYVSEWIFFQTVQHLIPASWSITVMLELYVLNFPQYTLPTETSRMVLYFWLIVQELLINALFCTGLFELHMALQWIKRMMPFRLKLVVKGAIL